MDEASRGLDVRKCVAFQGHLGCRSVQFTFLAQTEMVEASYNRFVAFCEGRFPKLTSFTS
jgi:hypothetical protein